MTDRPVKLYTSLASLEGMYEIANGKGKVSRVNTVNLLNLLMDHSAMVARLDDLGQEPDGKDGT